MNLFFLSLLTIFAGGLLSPLLRHHFKIMRWISTSFITAGSILGLIYAGSILLNKPASLNIDNYTTSFNYLEIFTISFKVDNLSAFFLLIIFLISLMTSIYSFHYMNKAENSLATSVNYLFFSLLILSICFVVTASNMIAFMFSWEMMSISSFFLVIYNYKSKENRRAGYLYFIFSHIGAMFILSSFALLYTFTGDFAFSQATNFTTNFLSKNLIPHNLISHIFIHDNIKLLIFILAFIGFGSKAGIFPFHVWLPHAHPAASSHISALMSGVMIKTGIYGIIRIYSILDFSIDIGANPESIIGSAQIIGYIVIVAGIVSGILGVVYALGQHDIKRLLAYSSIENIGIILIGIGIGMVGVSYKNHVMALLGFSGGLFHVFNHAIFKSLLFMGAGVVLHKTGSRSIDALGGLIKKMRITGITFLIGSIAISGLPPFNGFVSEFFIYIASFKGATTNLFAVNSIAMSHLTFPIATIAIISIAIIGGLSLACFTKVIGVVFQGEPRTRAAENVNEKGLTMLFPMVVLASLCLVIGVFPKYPLLLTIKAVTELFREALGTEAAIIELTSNITEMAATISNATLLFILVIIITIMLRHFAYRDKPVTRSSTWGCGFTKPTAKMQYTGSSYAASIVQFFKPFAPIYEEYAPVKGRMAGKSHYQSHINDIAELQMDRVTLKPVLFLFNKLHWIQHGDIHLYIGYILLAIIVAMFFV